MTAQTGNSEAAIEFLSGGGKHLGNIKAFSALLTAVTETKIVKA
jgi:hypothetical protein